MVAKLFYVYSGKTVEYAVYAVTIPFWLLPPHSCISYLIVILLSYNLRLSKMSIYSTNPDFCGSYYIFRLLFHKMLLKLIVILLLLHFIDEKILIFLYVK